MCGIYGKVIFDNTSVSKTELSRIDKSMSHRGPNGSGTFFSKNIGMGMRRLAIIDLETGQQPIYNEDKTISIIFNGEIYNYLELCKKLKNQKHKFVTESDTETIVHLYEEYGIGCLNKLRGMFAFALVDQKIKKMFLARDRMGEKPLYWTKQGNTLFFASEMKSLLKFTGVKRELNKPLFDQYFHFNYIPEPLTAFKDIQKLPAGCFLEIDLNNYETKQARYWDPLSITVTDDTDPTERIKDVFAESCKLQLRSDVPVGISLSGGIDSGSILAFAAPAYKDTMKAFSIGYEGTPSTDERLMARKLADQFKVEFFEAELKTNDVINFFPELVWHSDDPISDIAAYAIYSVNKLSHDNNVPVMLGGLGGDEMFWGYPWTQNAISSAIHPNQYFNWKSPYSSLLRLWAGYKPNKEYLPYYDLTPSYLMAESFVKPLYSGNFKDIVPENNNLDYMKYKFSDDSLAVAKHGMDLIRDLWLFSNCIALSDRLSMASSIELRSPFLDYKLVETALSSRKVVGGFNMPQKYWLKRAMKGILPEEVLNRPKRGFTPPVIDWVRGIIDKYIFLTKAGFLETEDIFSREKLNVLRNTWPTLPMYWYPLYQLVLLEIWGREYFYDQSFTEIKKKK